MQDNTIVSTNNKLEGDYSALVWKMEKDHLHKVWYVLLLFGVQYVNASKEQ